MPLSHWARIKLAAAISLRDSSKWLLSQLGLADPLLATATAVPRPRLCPCSVSPFIKS